MLDKVIGSTIFKFLFFGLCFAILFSKSDRYFGWTNSRVKMSEPVMSDGSGYYAHLPQWFTYHTAAFEFAGKITQKYPKSRFTDFIRNDTLTRKYYNKYYVGSAICLVPFYWTAQVHSKIEKVPNDGYSWSFLLWTNIGVIFFTILGGLGLFRLAMSYKIKPWVAYFGIACVFFGTNLCYYTTVEIPFSHGFGFAVNTWILVMVRKWAETNQRKHFYLFSALIGLAIVIRPTNAIIVFVIPFMFRSTSLFFDRLKELVLERKLQLLIGILLGFIFIAFQVWNVWRFSGQLLFNSYSTETFENWNKPEVWNVLFSWKKGLFVYTPVLILLFPAMVVCYRKERRLLWGIIIAFSLVTYSTAAWWTWTFGGGLGARNYIDFMALFILPVMILVQSVHWILKVAICGFAVFASWIYLVYDYQMRNAILHFDKMTYTSFREVFLQTGMRFKWHGERKFYTEPAQIGFKSGEMYFSGVNNMSLKNNEMESQPMDFMDNPFLFHSTKQLHAKTIDGKFGLKLDFEIKIEDEDNNPSVQIYLYHKDSVIHQEGVQYGGKIPDIKEWDKIQLYFNMQSRWNDVDSVNVWLYDGIGKMSIKNAKAQFYSYK